MNYIVSIGKSVSGLLGAAIMLVLGIYFITEHTWLAAIAFLALSAVYFVILLRNCAIIHVDEEKLERRMLFMRKTMLWSDVKEVVVLGTRIVTDDRKHYAGIKYIYFSPKALSDEERFDICLRWPPKDGFYIQFTLKRIHRIQCFWQERIETCNVGRQTF